jgi:hypothetical protein
MNVASSGSVEGTSVVVDVAAEADGNGVEVIVVVEDVVRRSFSSAAKRTMSFALTMRASRSCRASFISIAVLCAEFSTVRRMPSFGNVRP